MKWNVPNILTMARLVCTPVVAILFLLDCIPYGIGVLIAFGVYVLGCITDLLDGYIARKYNLVTDFGKFMDQIADKALTTTAMILVLFAGNVADHVWVAVAIVLVVVLRDIVISGIRMVSANKNVVISADMFGKIKSFFLDIGSMILMLYVGLRGALREGSLAKIGKLPIDYIRCLGLGVLIVGAVLAVISLVNYSIKAVQSFKEIENKK